VEPSEIGFDALGKGVGSEEPKAPTPVPAQRFLSSGFVRKQNLSNVVMMPQTTGASASPAHALQMRAAESVGVLALADVHVHHEHHEHVHVHAEPAMAVALDRRAEARLKGYEGESCSECGNFTMVRNGTCLKCDTCGSTSGCS
jgi:ribonucleoside-diphosphate reductase alpha chain